MAQVKYGAIVTDMKGKIGGTVFQGGTTGGVAKNIPPKKASTGSGKLTKADAGRVFAPMAAITVNASAWRDLTDSDRLAWNTAAANFPFTNKFGVPYTPSGYQLYMSVNQNLAVCAQPALSTPPLAGPLVNCGILSVSSPSYNNITIDVDGGVPPGYYLQLSATRGMSAGKGPGVSDYKLITVLSAGFVFPDDFFSVYVRQFGLPTKNSTVWFQGKLTKADAGRNSQPATSSVVITP